MKRKYLKVIAVLLVSFLLMFVFSACSDKSGDSKEEVKIGSEVSDDANIEIENDDEINNEEKEVTESNEDNSKQETTATSEENTNVVESNSNESQNKTEAVETNQTSTSNNSTVWVSSSGKGTKYHNSPNCSKMKNPKELTVDQAKSQGYSPCKKCYN